MTPALTRVMGLCEPVVQSMGFECVHAELGGGGGRGVLRFFIDGPDGVTVSDCTGVSRQLSAVLDVEDPISGAYTLEVSSPGLNRPLGRFQDFERFTGDQVSLVTAEALDGRRKWSGLISGIRDNLVMLNVDGEDVDIPFDMISRANIEFDYESALKQG